MVVFSAAEIDHPAFRNFNNISEPEGDRGFCMISALGGFQGTDRINSISTKLMQFSIVVSKKKKEHCLK